MAPSDDLKTHTHSTTDFYALLSLPPAFTQQELDRQWRRTALKYHPDKLSSSTTSPADRAAAAEKFHLAQIGYDLLSDPAARAVYDNTRNARLRRERERQVFADGRAKMRDELERREGGFKRRREEEEGEEERLERELRRLAEDGKRRRVEREEVLRKEMVAEKRDLEGEGSPGNGEVMGRSQPPTTTGVSELDRTVKVRWPLEEGDSTTATTITETQIESLFSTFGKVETVTMLKPKEVRLSSGDKRRKQLAGICMVSFSSIVGAHAAVEDFPKHRQQQQQQEHDEGRKKEGWQRLDSVSWAANKEPDFLSSSVPLSSSTATSPSTPAKAHHHSSPKLNAFLDRDSSRPATPTPAANAHTTAGLRKMPSFSSFSSATAFGTPKAGLSPFGARGANSPSLEELTMIRLKNAEKKRLREELVRQDERDAAAAATGVGGS
ncbi:MAG: hypothetical protein Q9220_003562 [cf. Caloplaca sp. 1 TL-2023]